MKKNKYVFIQDEDFHWYYVKEEERETFNKMCEEAYLTEDFDNFNEKFEKSMISCHPSNFSKFYNEDGTRISK